MQKSEMSSSDADREKPRRNPTVFWWLIGLATLGLLGSTWFAWQQSPHPDAYRTATTWFDPIEQNAFKRLPVIRSNLHAVFALDQRIWAVGGDGLIVHSSDGGESWQAQSSGTQAWLYSITFAADGERGWAGWVLVVRS